MRARRVGLTLVEVALVLAILAALALLPALLCPSRGRAAAQAAPRVDPLYPGLSYASEPAWADAWARTDYAANGLALPERGGRLLRLARMHSGPSHAVLLGEKALDVRA